MLKNFIKTRNPAFFMLAPVVVFALVALIIYATGFAGSDFYDVKVIVFLLLSIASYALSCFKITDRYASIVAFAFTLLAFVTFIDTSYMLLSTKFFNGLDPDMNILEQAGYEWSFTLIFIFLNLIIAFVTSFFEHRLVKKVKKVEKEID